MLDNGNLCLESRCLDMLDLPHTNERRRDSTTRTPGEGLLTTRRAALS